MELKKSQNDIVKVGLWFNTLIFIISLFYLKSWLIYTTIILNIILFGSYMIITKYFFMFMGLATANKFANALNKRLEVVNG